MCDDVFVNIHGLARVLRLPHEWLMAEAKAGRIPCMQIGTQFRFNVKAVKAALAEQAATVTVKSRQPEGESCEEK